MEENKNLETLGGLCSHMLSSPMPSSDEVRDCLTELGCGQRVLPILSSV